MNLQAQLIQLLAWAQEEAGAQEQLLKVLRAMDCAVRAGCSEDLMESGERLEKALSGSQRREQKRSGLMHGLAQHFGVAMGTLSLSSIIERARAAGQAVEALEGMRDRLRTCVKEVAQTSHILSVMATHHHGVLADMMAIIGASSNEEETRKHGVLVDAEA